MGGYTPRPKAAEEQPRLIRLDSNENPYGPSPRALEAMRRAISSTNSYPDDDSTALRNGLATHHAVPAEQVLVTAGSTGMLSLLCHIMLAPGLNAVTSERSFIVYSMAVQAVGARLIETPMREDRFDLGAILDAITEETRLVFVSNPNNPTGTVLEAAEVDRFLAEIPGHVVVVLDEAYHDYASYFAVQRKIEYSHSLDQLKSGASVVVLRTFSKAHGLAGLRIGYGIGPEELMTYCARMRDTFSVSSIAQAAALAALGDHNYVTRVVSTNAAQAQVVGVGLSELGYRVVPTSANFLYCDVGEDAATVADRLREQGVSVRPMGMWGAPNCLRVSVGTAEQNQFLLNAAHTIRRKK